MTTDWMTQHADAWNAPKGMEKAIVNGIKSWVAYADAFRAAYTSHDGYQDIGSDGYASEYFLAWGLALRGLLNMDTGRLDCGTLDGLILNTLKEHGFDLNKEGL